MGDLLTALVRSREQKLDLGWRELSNYTGSRGEANLIKSHVLGED